MHHTKYNFHQQELLVNEQRNEQEAENRNTYTYTMFTQQIILLTILCQVGVGFSLLSSASSFFSSPSSTSSIRNAYSTSTSTSLAYAFDTKEKTVTSTEEIINAMTPSAGVGTAVLEGVPVVTTTEDDDSWATTTQYYDVDAIIDGIDDAYSTLDIVNFDDIDIDMDNESTTRSSNMQQEQDRIRESIQESIENEMEDEIAMLHRVNAQPDLIDQETGRVTIIPTLLECTVVRVDLTLALFHGRRITYRDRETNHAEISTTPYYY